MREESPVVEEMCTRFYKALKELNWELNPAECGKFMGTLAELWNSTGDLPSKDAIRVMIESEYGNKHAAPEEFRPIEEWPPMQKAQVGKGLLADFLRTPPHLEAVRNFCELWRPFRHRIDGRVLLNLISKGHFPEWYRHPQSHRARFVLKKMEKFVNVVKGSPSLYQPKEGAAHPPAWLGKELLADFLQTPAHLAPVRRFCELWRPYRQVLDGEVLMNFIYKGYFPEEHWEAAKQSQAA